MLKNNFENIAAKNSVCAVCMYVFVISFFRIWMKIVYSLYVCITVYQHTYIYVFIPMVFMLKRWYYLNVT